MKEFLNWVDEQFLEMSGRPIENFEKYDTDDDFDDNYDSYDEFRIEYNRDNKFEAIEVYADKKVELIVYGKDCSDFSVDGLKALADDFEWDSDNTAWTSYSKQIGI